MTESQKVKVSAICPVCKRAYTVTKCREAWERVRRVSRMVAGRWEHACMLCSVVEDEWEQLTLDFSNTQGE
jgi:hypothetical protein